MPKVHKPKDPILPDENVLVDLEQDTYWPVDRFEHEANYEFLFHHYLTNSATKLVLNKNI
jgi:hypothetical protein